MKKMIAGFLFASLSAVSLNAKDIEGSYDVTGFDPYEKKSYTGTVEITKGANDVYQAQWTLNLVPKSYKGTGLKNKDEVSFIYQASLPRERGEVGLQVYAIKGNKLEGRFVYADGSLIGNETLTKK